MMRWIVAFPIIAATSNSDDLTFSGLISTPGHYGMLASTLKSVPLGATAQVMSYSESTTYTTLLASLASTTLNSSAVYSTYYSTCSAGCITSPTNTSCQCLANLCALSIYAKNSIACTAWSGNAATVSTIISSLTSPPSVSGASMPLNILAARYSASGQLLGYTEVGDALEVCGVSSATGVWKSGAQVNTFCQVSASSLANEPLVFYELHVLLNSGSRSIVPVKILNNGLTGSRFFLVDSATSASFVRYAAEVHFVRDGNGNLEIRIFYATLAYGGQSGAAAFRAEVGSSDSSYWYNTLIGLLAVSTFLGVVIGLFSGVCVSQRFGATSGAGLFFPRWAVQMKVMFHAIFSAYFFLLVVISCYWAMGYRGGDIGTLPTSADGGLNYSLSDGFVWLIFVFSAICILIDLAQATRQFVFFIDMEEPESASPPASPTSRPQIYGQPMAVAAEKPIARVSAWRSLFVANEFCERLTATRTSSIYTWIILIASLDLGSWEVACRFYPINASPFNPLLQTAIPVLIWLAIIIGTVVWQRLVAIWGGDDLRNFVDMCSLANISILIMDEPRHGWYVHGRAPSGKGDWSASELVQKLHEEESNLLLRRGLVPNDPRTGDLQTFELLLPIKFTNDLIAHFDEIRSTIHGIEMRGRVDTSDVVKMNDSRRRMQVDVQSMLELVVAEGTFRPKTVAERIGVSQVIDRKEKGVILEDWSGLGWAQSLLFGSQLLGFPTGSEFRLIAFELLIFLVTYRYTDMSVLAAAVAYLIGEAIRWLRQKIGQQVVSHTSGIDSRFFL